MDNCADAVDRLLIDQVALIVKQEDNGLGSIRPSVHQCALSRLNRLTCNLDMA